MKNILSVTALATVAAVSLFAGAANAQMLSSEGLYGSVKGGMTQQQNADFGGAADDAEFKSGWGMNAAVGKYMAPNVRGEVELGYYENDADNAAAADSEAWTGMLNAYYEPYANCRLKPYVGAGVGIANVDYKDAGDDTNLAMQAMAGASYDLTDKLTATAEYRYLQVMNTDVGTTNNDDYQNHMGLVGLRMKF